MGPILIVDDEFGIVETLRELLQDEGYRTMTARDGLQAMQRMAEERPALVLLDYMMPAMNGPAVLEAMAKDDALRAIPVVMMSASPLESWGKLPATAHLPKPFEITKLLQLIERLIGRGDLQ